LQDCPLIARPLDAGEWGDGGTGVLTAGGMMGARTAAHPLTSLPPPPVQAVTPPKNMNMRSTAVAAALALVLLATSASAGSCTAVNDDGTPAESRPAACIDLGPAADYAILAGFALTNVPASAITGDMGIWPAPFSAITAFDHVIDLENPTFFNSPQVTGKIYAKPADTRHATDATTGDVVVPDVRDAMIAFTVLLADTAAAAALPPPEGSTPIGIDMAGETFGPGLYTSTGSMAAAGDFYLDAGDDADAVFIFRMATTFSMAPGAKVILKGGALASNIFWQVGTSATIYTTAVMHGTIMAQTLVATQAGSSINGRLLVGPAGSVTLGKMTTVVKP
jgi:hypothetical protein